VRVLRPGAVGLAALRAVAPELQASVEYAASAERRASPGMGGRHYAPRARLVLAETHEKAESLAVDLASTGARVGLVVREAPGTAHVSVLVRELPSGAARYAHLLFGTLHDLDDARVDAIVVHDVPTDEAWGAVADRLRRAAATE
jgi:L-threonylcarbamoyladenylate synthase